MPNNEVIKKYNEVKTSLDDALATSDNIKLCGDEENAELTYVRETFTKMNNSFKEEIEKLEQSSEWDKFCMAFFGETNAGKSTIIDGLRVVYNEESRRLLIEEQEDKFHKELEKEKRKYSELVNSLAELNNSLAEEDKTKRSSLFMMILFVAIGIVVGFVVGLLVGNYCL